MLGHKVLFEHAMAEAKSPAVTPVVRRVSREAPIRRVEEARPAALAA